jgi:hypothetical protein
MSIYGTTIQYNDKVDLNTTSVADINKVSASDLNEIKAVVNGNANTLENTIGKTLWENQNPTASFSSQTITLSESLANYSCYEIIFRQSKTTTRYFSTGKIPVGYGTILNAYANNYRPTGTTVSDNTIAFENASVNGTTNNEYVIPVYVVGYKTGVY